MNLENLVVAENNKCSNNDDNMKKGHRSQLEDWPNGQIWTI